MSGHDPAGVGVRVPVTTLEVRMESRHRHNHGSTLTSIRQSGELRDLRPVASRISLPRIAEVRRRNRPGGRQHEGAGRSPRRSGPGQVDRLADCKIIFMTEIGGPSAARLVKKDHAHESEGGHDIEDSIRQHHETIMKSPPPWLKKALNHK